jgi:hypothetical protein
MDIKINEKAKTIVPSKGRIVISTRPHRVSEMLDKEGNVIDKRTKQIIKKAENNG